MNFEHARFNMIEQQIRPWDVTDPEVRQLLMTVRREDYVPTTMRPLAFADIEIPLPCKQVMFRPAIEGRILQAIGVRSTDFVLEVGTGSGYFAALLAARANRVCSVEIEPTLAQAARNNFALNRVENVIVEEGDASQGWYAQGPYDVIVVSGGLPELSPELLSQLKPGGRMFAFVGETPALKAYIIKRKDEKQLLRRHLFETVVPMLQYPLQTDRFRF